MSSGASKPRRGPMRSAQKTVSRVGWRREYPNLLISIHVLSSLIGRAFYGELATRFGIGIAEWRILLTLAERKQSTSVDIAAEWAMEKMAISRAVRRLEKSDFVTRRVDSGDKRRQVLRLTASGRKFHARILPVANARYREIADSLSRAEFAAIRRSLARLIERTAQLAERQIVH